MKIIFCGQLPLYLRTEESYTIDVNNKADPNNQLTKSQKRTIV